MPSLLRKLATASSSRSRFSNNSNRERTTNATMASPTNQSNAPESSGSSSSSSSNHPESPSSSSFDQQMLARTLADTSRWSYGIVWAEVWLLGEDRRSLCLPPAGMYVDPVFYRNSQPPDEQDRHPVDKLTDPSCQGYIAPNKVIVGEGLPGTLWSEDTTGRHGGSMTRARVGLHQTNTNQNRLKWRNLDDIASDPHKAWNPRLHQLSLAGLGWAAAVPIYYEGEKQGMLIYMARRTIDLQRLQSDSNDDYLHNAANLVAATLAIRKPRKRVVQERQEELSKTIRRIRIKIAAISLFGRSMHDVVQESQRNLMARQKTSRFADWTKDISSVLSERSTNSFRLTFGTHFKNKAVEVADRFVHALEKCRGAAVPLPPTFGWIQTFHSFVGCFITLLMLTYLNKALINTDKGDAVTLILGPFGALTTLIFGLTAAPAAQPRNAVLGQAVSITIAILMREMPLEREVRIALSVALAVGTMCKLGLTHPPAGASAVVFASNSKWGFTHMGVLLVGNVLTVLAAAFVNNWSDQRQYPTFWGFAGVFDAVDQCFSVLQARRNRSNDDSDGEHDFVCETPKMKKHLEVDLSETEPSCYTESPGSSPNYGSLLGSPDTSDIVVNV